MFLANGDFDSKNQKNIEKFDNLQLYGVGEAPNITDEEIKDAQDRLNALDSDQSLDKIKSLEIGSLFHKKIRSVIRPHLKPGLKLSQLANLIEGTCMKLTKKKGINFGIGFPSSLSVNKCAAHFTPSKAHDITLDENSVTKIDFGVEVNGWITDCAFTVAFNDKYINLINAVKEATNHGIKTVAMDQDIGEWGEGIREIMESYEVTIDGKSYPVNSIRNLGGHSILKGKIHGGTFLPSSNVYKNMFLNSPRFSENVYAVETFGSTKDLNVHDEFSENSIYMRNLKSTSSDSSIRSSINPKYHKIFDIINSRFKTLPFCDRYLESYDEFKEFKLSNYDNLKNFKNSVLRYFNDKEIYISYPPLYNSGISAQYEHTLYLSESKKIVFSNSSDY